MLNSHVFSSSSNDGIHSANSTINPNALSGISCDLFQDSMCLSMQHSVFAVNLANKTAFDSETWVLNIGAIDHIIHSITLFTKITSSISTFVQLPNGERVTITHIGTIQVTSTLVLENILCVPSFSFNCTTIFTCYKVQQIAKPFQKLL